MGTVQTAGRGGTFVAVLCLVLAGAAMADGPTAGCSARVAGSRALVDVELRDFLDSELLKVIRLGLVGRIHLDVSLSRPRPLWFDEPVLTQAYDVALRWSKPESRYVLDGRVDVEDPARFTLERMALRPAARFESDGRYKVEVRVHLQVVTAASLGKALAWMVGKEGGVPEGLLATLANDLARVATCACAVLPAG